MLHEGVHDPRRHDSPLHRPGDATGPTDGVDGAHVERVPALDPLAAARHAQRGAEDRGLEVVHCDGVAAEQRAHVAVADEPDQVFARPGMHQRGPHDPQSLAAALLLLAQQLRQQAVVRRPLAGHFRLHEAELVGAVTAAEEALDVYVDALAAVLRRADGDRRALLAATRLGHHEVAVRVEDDHAVQPGEPRWAPCTAHLDVGRKVRGRKKPSGRTPSAGAGSKRASGAPESGGASKLGGRYWKRGRCTLTGSVAVARAQTYAGRIPSRNGSAHNSDTGSRSTTTAPRARALHARTTRPIARASVAFTSTCQRQRPLSRSIGQGAGPSTVSPPASRSVFARRSQAATRSAACCVRPGSAPLATKRARPTCGGYAGPGGARSGSSATAKSLTEWAAAARIA